MKPLIESLSSVHVMGVGSDFGKINLNSTTLLHKLIIVYTKSLAQIWSLGKVGTETSLSPEKTIVLALMLLT